TSTGGGRAAICSSPVAYGSLRAANCTDGFLMYTLSLALVQKVGPVTKVISFSSRSARARFPRALKNGPVSITHDYVNLYAEKNHEQNSCTR
ncbi:MAG TPA: hypothetical protein VHX36_05075, partial [Candidatus Acidoferrales bacterium]|nr:hypothetical protein [Candidatus Acidoferrales bacterium]